MIKIYDVADEHKACNGGYCTYAWIFSDDFSDEILNNTYDGLKVSKYGLPIAVFDYRPENAKRNFRYVLADPVWDWIAQDRISEEQEYINSHINEIERAFRNYIGKK